MKQRRLSVVFLVLGLAAAAVQSSAEEPSMREYRVPAGSHPHDVAPAPDGSVYYASLAGNHVARIDTATGAVATIDPPTSRQGARIRQILGRKGEVWGAESGADRLVVIRHGTGR